MVETPPDALMGGRLRLHQAPRGHRAGTDALLLAAAAAAIGGTRFVDVGAGAGTAGLALARLRPDAHGVLLEADPNSADLARRNATLNDLDGRVGVVAADLFVPAAMRAGGLGAEAADLVLTNPPFYTADAVRTSPDAARAAAHVLGRATHGDWLRAAVALLAPKGHFVAIHRPDALPALLAAAEGRLGGVTLRAVHARHDREAIRILLWGVKGSRAPMRIAPGFVLHEADGRFTPEAEAVHRGEATLPAS